jgi:hypothetical protein
LATKIHGQPTDQDSTLSEKELISIAANVPTALGGGNHGHARIIVEPTKYLAMTRGTAFVNPVHPGIYPEGLAANVAAGTRAMAEAVHKEQIAQFKIFAGVEQALRDIILEAVDHDNLLEIEDDTLGFLNQTPRSIINHLRSQGGALDFADTKTLPAERDAEWDVSEVPQIYFNRVEKAIKGLTRAGIVSDLNEKRDMALYYLKASGEFDAAVCEWKQKPSASKTWTNIKSFIATEYARENKQNKLTAKQYKANAMEEQAEATEELIANLTESHTRQMETLIKNTTEAMKEMMALVKSEIKPSEKNPSQTTMICQKGEERKELKKDAKCTTTHQFVNIATESTLQRKKRNVGNSKQMQHPAHCTRKHPRAPEGSRGLKKKQRRGNQAKCC